ncbi:MAG: helix-turn-helix domain-containing protein [Clostridiales bacterium]|nr:helix-turn-helix domain-containing protein [Clostridiales bacterium]
MDHYITGATIRRLREAAGLTQAELALRLCVSDKTISKWETAKGLPDISLIEPLANALKISVIELFSGECVTNANRSCNMKRSRLYVCPICGNVIHAAGGAVISCCGVTLPPLEAEEPDENHAIQVARTDGDYYVTLRHPMSKTHYISFIAFVTDSRFDMVKLYPEGSAEARFFSHGRGEIYCYCNQHGLMKLTLDPRKLK